LKGYFQGMLRFTELPADTNEHDSKAKEFDQQLSGLSEISYSKEVRAGFSRNRTWEGGRALSGSLRDNPQERSQRA
jgi:hypothetical protein